MIGANPISSTGNLIRSSLRRNSDIRCESTEQGRFIFTMSTVSYVPPELWLEIFQWATSYPEAYATSYSPFCPLETPCQDTAISCSLALVCRLWRALVTEFLYRDVRIGHGQSIDTLKGALCAKQGYSRFGMFLLLSLSATFSPTLAAVRRAVLPFQSTSTSTYSPSPIPSVEILQLCTELEVCLHSMSIDVSV